MAESRYEKNLCRNPVPMEQFYRDYMVGTQTMPPLIFSNGNNPIKEANQFVEFKWIWAPSRQGDDPKEQHYHEFDEMFMWLGTDRDNPSDLGGEVEFWMGQGEERDKVTFNTSSLLFVPKGLWHLPIVYKRVDRPFIHLAIGINSGAHVESR